MVGVIVVINVYMYCEMQNEKLMKFVFFSRLNEIEKLDSISLNLVQTRLEFRSRFFYSSFLPSHTVNESRERTCEVRSRFRATVWNGLNPPTSKCVIWMSHVTHVPAEHAK